MIPPQLLKEAEAVRDTQTYEGDRYAFMAGVRWLFQRLSEMSEAEFDQKNCGNFAVECTRTLPSDWSEHDKFAHSCGIGVGMRHQHALNQIALLKAREEVARLEETRNALYAQTQDQRARCERYKEALKYYTRGKISGELARQALSGAENV